MANPFILTATIPEPLRGYAEGLRRAHFPPERNFLHAHVTLFHAFAPSLRDELASYLPRIAAEYASPQGRVTGLIDFGRGTAIRLEAPGLKAIRREISEHFHGSLTDQDLHELRLHITVQNKVTPRTMPARFRPGSNRNSPLGSSEDRSRFPRSNCTFTKVVRGRSCATFRSVGAPTRSEARPMPARGRADRNRG